MHHDGDGVKAICFQQGREDGGSDVVGQVGTGHGPQTGKFLCHQSGHILVQHIIPDDFQVVKFAYGLFQNGGQALVQFHGADLFGPQAQLLGQRADAGADLQHTGGLVHAGVLGDGFGHPFLGQEVLTLGFGKMETMLCKQRLHNIDIANIDHNDPPFFCSIIAGNVAFFNGQYGADSFACKHIA